MLYIIYAILIAGIGLIFWSISGAGTGTISTGVKLPEAQSTQRSIRSRSFLSTIFPSRNLLEQTRLGSALKGKLDAAHMRLTPVEFFNLKLIVVIVIPLVIYFSMGKVDPYILLGGILVGYIIPDFIIKQKIKARKEAIARLLPETVDLLGLCVEAGLDFTMAVKWIIEKTPMNPFLEELSFLMEEIKWGKPRSQALKDMSKRLSIPEVSSFVQTLVLAERMGTPVSEAFNILSEDTRMQRFHQGERQAMKAPIKILIPLIFCILPVIAIVIGAPIFLEFMGNSVFK